MQKRGITSHTEWLAPTSIRVLIALALFASFGGSTLDSAEAAGPARYILEKCDAALPNGGTEGAIFTGSNLFTPGNNCAEPGGALIILQANPVSSTEAHWTLPLPAPPGGTMESVRVTAEVCNGTNHDPGTIAYAVQPEWPLTFTCAPDVRTFPINSPAGNMGLVWLGCEGSCERDPFVWAHYFAATEQDPNAPEIKSLGGTLLAGGTLRGHQGVSVSARDEGGGLSRLSILVNGQAPEPASTLNCQTAQANNTSVVGTVAITATPCPRSGSASWTLDTESAPFHPGANQVQVCASDFATLGDPNTTCSSAQFKVDNSCTGSHAGGGERINAAFSKTRGPAITVAYGKGASIAGRLVDGAGNEVGDATICVQVSTQGSADQLRSIGTTTTNASGRFSYRLGPGPNRQVVLGYRHDSFQVTQELDYHAHARPTLGLSSSRVNNGDRIRIFGQVPGPRAGGRVVVLQASALHSSHWFTFHRATANRFGSFHSFYRFDATTRTTTYRIRAVIPRQHGYPWAIGQSKPRLVEVRG